MSILSGANASLSNALTLLGYNGWQLQDGSYNGITFVSFTQFGVLENNPVFQAGANTVATINQLTGLNLTGGDPNSVGELYNTFLTILQFTDETIFNIVEKRTPYTQSVNLEDVGTSGREFKMVLWFAGNDYQKAETNFRNAIVNPPLGSDKVLVHPTLGLISGRTYVTKYATDTSFQRWNSTLVNITFRSELSGNSTLQPNSKVLNVLNAIQSILALILAIQAELAVLAAIAGSYSSGVNSTTITLYNNTNYAYKTSNLVTSNNVTNTSLDTTPVNYNLLNIISNNFNVSVANLILADYGNQVKTLIDNLGSLNNGLFNNLINLLTISVSRLYDLYLGLLENQNQNQSIITAPYDLTLRELLTINNIDTSNIEFVFNLNPNLQTCSYIPKGTKIIV